jgi:nucleotide-binding universal stress UspA family protein
MKVLIPVDGSEQSLYTIKAAARFLNREASRIHLLTVKVPIAAEVPWALMEDEEDVLKILDRAKLEANTAGFQVEKAVHVTFHEPASAICEYADEIQADLILVGSHGYQGLAKFLMGSVSERVFKEAKQPVIIIRNDQSHSLEISHFEKAGFQQKQS